MRKTRLVVSVLAGAALLFSAGCHADSNGKAAEGQGSDVASAKEAARPAPDFELPDTQGNPLRLSDHRGKTVVVDFWATWCPPCVFQVPELNKLWEAHRDAGDVMVIGVSIDVEGPEAVEPWLAEHGVSYPIVYGSEDLAHEFGAVGFPTLVVVSPEGEVESLHVGLIQYEDLEELVGPKS